MEFIGIIVNGAKTLQRLVDSVIKQQFLLQVYRQILVITYEWKNSADGNEKADAIAAVFSSCAAAVSTLDNKTVYGICA